AALRCAGTHCHTQRTKSSRFISTAHALFLPRAKSADQRQLLSTPQRNPPKPFDSWLYHLRALLRAPVRDAPVDTTARAARSLCYRESFEIPPPLPTRAPVSGRPGRAGIAARIRPRFRSGTLFAVVLSPATNCRVATPTPRGSQAARLS